MRIILKSLKAFFLRTISYYLQSATNVNLSKIRCKLVKYLLVFYSMQNNSHLLPKWNVFSLQKLLKLGKRNYLSRYGENVFWKQIEMCRVHLHIYR
jgi:hypothetical protein